MPALLNTTLREGASARPHKLPRRHVPLRTDEIGRNTWGAKGNTGDGRRHSMPARTHKSIGTVRDQAAGEQSVRHEDAEVENPVGNGRGRDASPGLTRRPYLDFRTGQHVVPLPVI